MEETYTLSNIPENLSILPLRNAVIYPHITVPIFLTGEDSMKLVEETMLKQKLVGIVTQKAEEVEKPTSEDLYNIGTVGRILKMVRPPEGGMFILIQGIARMKVLEYLQEEPHYTARIEPMPDVLIGDRELEAMVKHAKDLILEMTKLGYNIPREVLMLILNVDEPGLLADMIAETPAFSIQERQHLLEMTDVKARMKQVIVLLTAEKEHLEISHQIQSEVQSEMDKTQREYYLREQLRAIQKELGEGDEKLTENEELQKRLEEISMPDEARKVAEKERDRLQKMHPASAEYTVSRTYLDWIMDVPWEVSSEDNLDVKKAEVVLEEDHYGLEKIKKRILEYLAVRQLNQESKGPILCFVGPPGVGKTSLGRSIARALNREFVRMSLGGIRDEAEIRGHRRTYIGALPGRIIQGLKKAGTNNPVFMLDEIDKVGADFRGDPASALLEVLDPEQNNTFADHYLEIPFDLSNVMFIATANILSTIPAPLLDRMEVIDIAGYTEEEKVNIAQKYLIPKQLEANGVRSEQLSINEDALKLVVRSYTREAGVRNLERQIAGICRGVAKEIVDRQFESLTVEAARVPKYLGPIKYFSEIAERTAQPGVATGLAWTPVGGDILFVEAAQMKGHEKLILTGKLGDVMKESAEIALSYLRSKAHDLGIPEDFTENKDIHLHVPSGAIPKDGPSAGVTLYTSLASLFKNVPVRNDVAMTGEVTLRGNVLPVGGIKEKVLAAYNAGVKHIILPARNEKDLDEIPVNVKEDLSFHFVQHIDDVLKFALVIPN